MLVSFRILVSIQVFCRWNYRNVVLEDFDILFPTRTCHSLERRLQRVASQLLKALWSGFADWNVQLISWEVGKSFESLENLRNVLRWELLAPVLNLNFVCAFSFREVRWFCCFLAFYGKSTSEVRVLRVLDSVRRIRLAFKRFGNVKTGNCSSFTTQVSFTPVALCCVFKQVDWTERTVKVCVKSLGGWTLECL
mgnify:CR=1 FL=1